MDPISALGLAANVIQLVSAARSIVSIANSVSRSSGGVSKNIEQFEVYATEVRNETTRILSASKAAKDHDKELVNHAARMQSQIDAYMTTLDKFKLQGPPSRLQVIKISTKIWRAQERLEKDYRAINDMGYRFTSHIIQCHLQKISSQIRQVHNQTTDMEQKLSHQMEDLMTLVKRTRESNESASSSLIRAMGDWSRGLHALKVQRRCLEALYFQEIDTREDSVAKAHKHTFEWIFQDSTNPVTGLGGSQFTRWLQSTERHANYFWISGKPGAGKSTLMKFLARHDSLKCHLHEWAGGNELVIAEYYFWKYGSNLQRSIWGLMQSLLFKILQQAPELISHAFDNPIWMNGGQKFRFSKDEIEEALTKVLDLGKNLRYSFFIMVDGLDELDDRPECGNHIIDEGHLVKILQVFANKPSTKLCVSSRPHNVFKHAFGQDGDFFYRIHDLTRNDIRSYTKQEMALDREFRRKIEKDPEYEELIEEIVDAADGVFLWVHLVTRSLLQGVADGDRIQELRKILKSIPREIEDLYSLLLSNIKEKYRQSSSKMFLAVICMKEWMKDSRLKYRIVMSPLFIAYWNEPEYSEIIHEGSSLWEMVSEIFLQTEKQVNAQCQGLLECAPLSQSPTPSLKFCHRTLGDFISSPIIKQDLWSKANEDDQSLRSSVLKGIFGTFAACVHALMSLGDPATCDLHRCVRNERRCIENCLDFMDILCQVNSDYQQRMSLWADVDRILTWTYSNTSVVAELPNLFRSFGRPPNSDMILDSFRVLLRYPSTDDYNEAKLVTNASFLRSHPRIHYFLLEAISTVRMRYFNRLSIFSILLTYGADPNKWDQSYQGTSWQLLLEGMHASPDMPRMLEERLSLVKLFIQHGANLDEEMDLLISPKGSNDKLRVFRLHRGKSGYVRMRVLAKNIIVGFCPHFAKDEVADLLKACGNAKSIREIVEDSPAAYSLKNQKVPLFLC